MGADVNISNFLMPWEHYVCCACLRGNPHAIWLVKCRCFEPQQHGREGQALVTIDHDHMEMVNIRLLPEYYSQLRGRFVKCWHSQNCPNGLMCTYAHSKVECETWNIKTRIIRGTWTYNYDRHKLLVETKQESTVKLCIGSLLCHNWGEHEQAHLALLLDEMCVCTIHRRCTLI